ncbi:hypothetical protein Nepgr_010789 [Nepenthes gracilis]|uniref:Uncharacterized protein n=1 Tax=Nepenthes gracilis TaxID=150966 RepID=A0AAD3SDL0_NEPGR|nr:hypothetical protein Nepgr_010789 [Nepenthes gracilis]
MLLIDSTMSVQFRSSTAIAQCRQFWSSEDGGAANVILPCNKINRLRKKCDNSFMRRKCVLQRMIQAHGKYLGSGSDQIGDNGKSSYHPFEDIIGTEGAGSEEPRLTAAETSRTIIEVNTEATLMFSSLANDEVQHNIFWPDLPYLTDEHGNIYFQVSNDEDIMQTLTSEDNYVQVIIGLDTKEMMNAMDLSGPTTIDFGIEEIEDDDSDFDEDNGDGDDDDDDSGDGEWVDILEDEEDEVDSDGSLGDWAKLETMRPSHPMYFATKIAEVASDDSIDIMEQTPAGLAFQGLIRPTFIEEQSVIQKLRSNCQNNNTYVNEAENPTEVKRADLGVINGNANDSASSEDISLLADDMEKDDILGNAKAFYKLEMTKIELISANGRQTLVDVEEYTKARPDAIAHSAAKIISRVNSAGENTTRALKSLCWRCKSIHVEEASLTGIDTLGFDLRVCSGTQVQTLRFAFDSQATSEYSAERQLNDLLCCLLFKLNLQMCLVQMHGRMTEFAMASAST